MTIYPSSPWVRFDSRRPVSAAARPTVPRGGAGACGKPEVHVQQISAAHLLQIQDDPVRKVAGAVSHQLVDDVQVLRVGGQMQGCVFVAIRFKLLFPGV